MARKKIRQQSADVVLLEVVAKEVKRDALPAIEKKLSRFLSGSGAAPDLAQLAAMVVSDVRRRHQHLEEARHAEGCAKAAVAQSRCERDEAGGTIHRLLSELRDVLRAVSRRRPEEAPAWLLPEIPQQPHRLLRTAERVLTVLRGPGSLLPEGSPVRVDAGKTASELEQAAGALRRALPGVELRLAEAGLMRQRREEAEAVFEADCAAGLRLLTALGAYGGNKEMAGRMRGEVLARPGVSRR